jgi:tetratricopeptide (TPR) repeat protein
MRNVIVISVLIALGLPAGALAQSNARGSTGLVTEEPQVRIDRLFGELKRARNEQVAERVAGRIVQEWLRSGSATIDLMMLWAQKAIEEQKNDVALDFLDQVVILAPDYPESWNRRAAVHLSMQQYSKAMADIGRTLQLEPRHFGALANMAAILQSAGSDTAAMHAYERLLDVYPMLRQAQDELGKMADTVTGERI